MSFKNSKITSELRWRRLDAHCPSRNDLFEPKLFFRPEGGAAVSQMKRPSNGSIVRRNAFDATPQWKGLTLGSHNGMVDDSEYGFVAPNWIAGRQRAFRRRVQVILGRSPWRETCQTLFTVLGALRLGIRTNVMAYQGGFLAISEFTHIAEDHKKFLCGRRGAGKSAIAVMLERSKDY